MPTWSKILVIVVVIAAGGYLAYRQVVAWRDEAVQDALERERRTVEVERSDLEGEIEDLQSELDLHRENILPSERLEEVFGPEAGAGMGEPVQRSCEEIDRQVMDFFNYLDKQAYVQAWDLPEGAYGAYVELVRDVSAKPPLVTGEAKDPYSLISNVAHFYRVLGKTRVAWVREVLVRESEVVEPVAEVFFEWFASADRCRTELRGRPSLETLYEYAAFFLNTLAGKAYLLRRDSKVRILTTYYSVRIVDLANREMLNRHGLDIRPLAERTARDIRDQKGLVSRKRYLDALEASSTRGRPDATPAGGEDVR